MSAFKRLAAGAAASWVRIGVSMVSQVLLIPVFLRYWTPEIYGGWLALFAFIGFINIFSIGFQTYMGNEFLKWVHQDRDRFWGLFMKSLRVGVLISLLEFLAVFILVISALYTRFIPLSSAEDRHGVALVLIIYSLMWCLLGGVGGLVVRVLIALGYFSRMAWWGVCSVLVMAVAPAIAVLCGAGLVGAGLALSVATLVYNIPFFWDMWRLLSIKGMPMALGGGWAWREALMSLGLTLRILLEMMRQQGVRLVLAPLAGTANLAAFATMRTGANVAMQGIGSISQPLLPELMRFIHQRDQARSEASFASIWLIVACVLVPAVLVLQAVAAPLYAQWTLGRIEFDSVLFAALSLGVVVLAMSQPAAAIVQGHNLVKSQLLIMAVAGAVGVGGMFVLVPALGIRGAGLALLAAEVVSALGFAWFADRWMQAHGMHWPRVSQLWIVGAVIVCALGLGVQARWPLHPLFCLGPALVATALAAGGYIKSLPLFARQRLWSLCRFRAQ